ncbi:hypothetical protein F5Y15DRAFT_39515 [Xylariaceae sp. FL0016]|nr:hypothetical protein F5Y15DRAFT_39515 [Xylariaceae sp. FL0016]
MAPPSDNNVGASPRDTKILVAAFMSMKTAPQLDYDKFAQNAGFKNGKVASTIWSTLKKKYDIATGPGPSTPTGKTIGGGAQGSKSSGKRKLDDAMDVAASPLAKKRPSKKGFLGDEDEDEDSKAKVKQEIKAKDEEAA